MLGWFRFVFVFGFAVFRLYFSFSSLLFFASKLFLVSLMCMYLKEGKKRSKERMRKREKEKREWEMLICRVERE